MIHKKVKHTIAKLIHNQYWQERFTKSDNRSEFCLNPTMLLSACREAPSRTCTSFRRISEAVFRLLFRSWASETISIATFSCISRWKLNTTSASSDVSAPFRRLVPGISSSLTSFAYLLCVWRSISFDLSSFFNPEEPGDRICAATSRSEAVRIFSASTSPFRNRVFRR